MEAIFKKMFGKDFYLEESFKKYLAYKDDIFQKSICIKSE